MTQLDHVDPFFILKFQNDFRVDFNVPMKEGIITSNQRIIAALDTIKYILDQKPKCVILISHLGRPDGMHKMRYTLRPVAEELEKLLANHKVIFLPECVGDEITEACHSAEEG